MQTLDEAVNRWERAKPADSALAAAIAAGCGSSSLLAELLAQRAGSLSEARAWLRPLETPLCDPMAFAGMPAAVERIRQAIARDEPITVFGDYDTDGVTATALLVHALAEAGAHAIKPFFPDREREGYGLTEAALRRCLENYAPRPALLITVDCGISSVTEVDLLRRQQVDVILTDHHTPPKRLPDALAIVNPLLGAPKGATSLCGCAVAFELVRALELEGLSVQSAHYADLTAVASIADVMDLRGETRLLTARGLDLLCRGTGNGGLAALAEAAQLADASSPSERVAFSLVPCINAAGRLASVHDAWRLIGLERREWAAKLVALNQTRRQMEAQQLALAETLPKDSPAGRPFVVGHETFHPGILGVIAARLAERFAVPVAVVQTLPDGGGRGSVRAGALGHAVRALDTVADLLSQYGGHAAAAGFTLRPGAYGDFCRRFPEGFGPAAGAPPLVYDADLDGEPITLSLCRELAKLEPFGKGNPKPRFAKSFRVERLTLVGSEKTHVNLLLAQEGGESLKAVWFGAAERVRAWRPGSLIRALVLPTIDRFRGECPAVQLVDAFLERA